jgi:hypothetical protein
MVQKRQDRDSWLKNMSISQRTCICGAPLERQMLEGKSHIRICSKCRKQKYSCTCDHLPGW